jgi:class 3 adenylate cyclase
MTSPTRYTDTGNGYVAWAAHGDGPVDLVFCGGFISHVEHMLAHPASAGLYDRLAAFSRVLLFDRRGTGLSDRVVQVPTLEDQMQDVIAVMDAAGSERAALVGFTGGASLAITAAATYPERCSALILLSGFARNIWAPDYDWAPPADGRAGQLSTLPETWGTGNRSRFLFPSKSQDPSFVEWFGALERLSAGPGDGRQLLGLLDLMDVRDVLPSVRVPTLVLHPAEPSFLDPRHAEYLTEHIEGARLARFPGADAMPLERAAREMVVGEIEELVTGTRHEISGDRALATVLFTDIVDSTAQSASVGDDAWAGTLEEHEQLVFGTLRQYHGRAVKGLGDGYLATFEGPTSAVRCALELVDASGRSGLPIRAGLHTGEVERVGDDIRGIAVSIGARVSALAGGGEVLVSQTVKDLVVGSGLGMQDRGEHELKGVPGTWRVHRAST